MANPRQRRKARSGTTKVKQSRRQQDKLRKIIVTGPEALRKEWDVRKTARQNLEKLGLASRPLALRQSGGTEKDVKEVLLAQNVDDESAGSGSEADDYAESDSDEDEEDEDDANMQERPPQPSTSKTSSDIPKGYARIIRDEKGNVVDVVMSAYDEPDEPAAAPASAEDQQVNTDGEAEGTETQDTPWGKPMTSKKEAKRLKKLAEPVPAKNAAVRDLEARSQSQRSTTSASTRFASSQEIEHLRKLVAKHGDDVSAMAKDLKLNADQRTAGQLRKAFARVGGIESLKST